MKQVKDKFMSQDFFLKILRSKDYFTLFISEFKIDRLTYTIGLLVDIRYIIFIYKSEDLVLNNKKEEIIESIRDVSKNFTIKICIENELDLRNFIRSEGFEFTNSDIEHNRGVIENNKKVYKATAKANNVKLEDVAKFYNNKEVKPIARKQPAYWFNLLKSKAYTNKVAQFDDNGADDQNDVEIILPGLKNEDSAKDMDLKIGNMSLKDLNKESVENFVNQNYDSDWANFCIYALLQFKSFSETLKKNYLCLEINNKYAHETLAEVKKNKEAIERDRVDIKKKYDSIRDQYKTLESYNMDLKKQLGEVYAEIEIQKQKRLNQEERLLKRKKAKKQPKRDKMEYEEFSYILSLVEDMTFYNARRRCAFILLYITGLRVSNLLLLKKDHILKLLASGSVRLDLIKRGEREHLITISNKSRELLNQNLDYFFYILKRKREEEFFFSTIEGGDSPLDRCVFNRELNGILKKASIKYDKNFKTHSFRATFITDLLKKAPIHIAKDIVGHEVVSSTEIYYRSSLTKKDSLEILNSVDTFRFN